VFFNSAQERASSPAGIFHVFLMIMAPQTTTTTTTSIDQDEETSVMMVSSTAAAALGPIPYAALKQKRQSSVIDYFQSQCEKPNFLESFHEFCQKYANDEEPPRFHANPYLLLSSSSSSPGYGLCLQRFEKALLTIQDQDCLQVVFHGTKSCNVTSILQSGLDPNRRSGQSLGPGEYFAVDPMIAALYSYNSFDWESAHVIVCLAILPRTPVKDYNVVVINDPNHHVPIGSMQCILIPDCFVKRNKAQRQLLELRYNNFHKRLQRFELPVEQKIYRVKRQILLDLQRKEPAMASDLYRRYSDLLLRGGGSSSSSTAETKREILARVRQFPEYIIAIKFPGLLEEEESQQQISPSGPTTTVPSPSTPSSPTPLDPTVLSPDVAATTISSAISEDERVYYV
jgi:Poly(ADP-ribose) polymerase catalytic domain